MSRALQSSLTALNTAVIALKDERTTAVLKNISRLLKQPKPGDVLSTGEAQELVDLFEEEIEILYSRLPQATANLSTSYLTELFRLFKGQQSHPLWQLVAGKGVLNGLVACLQAGQIGDDVHFEKPFILALCQLLISTSSPKHPRLTTDLRCSAGAFLAEVTAKNEKIKKWMLEPKVLGIAALGDLIITESEFRVLDTCFEIATRLAPKRSDPQARRAFFTDVFNSTSAKATFGGDTCKNIMRIVEQPLKGRTWFQISDELFAEISGNPNSPQRFVMELLIVSGKTYSAEKASLRLFLDKEIAFNAFILDEEEEISVTTSYDNLSEVYIDHTKDSTSANMVLKAPPTWHNRSELLSQGSSLSVTILLSAADMSRFQEVLRRRGQAVKVYDRSKPTKQSFASHPLQLYQSQPPVSPALQDKTEIMKSFIPSSTPVPEPRVSQDVSMSVQEATRMESEVFKPEDPRAISQRPVSRNKNVSEAAAVELPGIAVRRGVIVDESDEDPPPESLSSKSKPRPALKRKSSELTDIEDISSSSVRKRARVEKKDVKAKPTPKPRASGAAPKPSKAAHPPIHSRINARINGMKTMDGARPAASTPPRRAVKVNIPRSVQEPSQIPAEEIDKPATTIRPARKTKPSKAEPEKAIWEYADFSQKAALMFPTTKAGPEKTGAVDVVNTNGGYTENQCADEEMFNAFIVDYGDEDAPGHPEDRENPVHKYQAGKGEDEDEVGDEVEDEVEEQHDIQEVTYASPSRNTAFESDIAANETENQAHPEDKMAVDDIPATPTPSRVAQRFDSPAQEEGPSSPIRPIMVLKRKLRDADAISQRAKAQAPKSARRPIPIDEGEESMAYEEEKSMPASKQLRNLRVLMSSPPKEIPRTPKTLARRIEMQPLRSFLRPKASQKKQVAVNWAVPINPPRPRPTVTAGAATKLGAEKQSKDVRDIKQATRYTDTKKAPKYHPPPRAEAMEGDSESEAEQKKVPAPPESGIDAIAEVLSAIQDTLLENIQSKVSGVRREARLARANLLEAAILDLEVMQENHESSYARFMRLEEKCGDVSQSVIGALAEVHAANQLILTNLDAVIREHDDVAAAAKAGRKPLFPKKLPACLVV